MLPALKGETDDGWLQHKQRGNERERDRGGRQILAERPNTGDNGEKHPRRSPCLTPLGG